MKRLLNLLIILFCILKGFSQDLSTLHDGITFSYYCSANDSSSRTIFVGQNDSAYTFQINHKTIKRVHINNPNLLSELDKLLTFGLISKLSICCNKHNCPDTICYYYLNRKKGKKSETVYIDLNFIGDNICGQNDLKRLIEILNIISK